MDPRSAPPVLARHPPDKISDLPSDRCPARRPSPSGEPPPVEGEARAVPADHRLRLHDDDRIGPSCPHAPQHDPERPIHRPDPRPTLLQDGGELLTEGEVLDHEAALRSQPREERGDDRTEKSNHGGRRGCRPALAETVNNSRRNPILARDRSSTTRREAGPMRRRCAPSSCPTLSSRASPCDPDARARTSASTRGIRRT